MQRATGCRDSPTYSEYPSSYPPPLQNSAARVVTTTPSQSATLTQTTPTDSKSVVAAAAETPVAAPVSVADVRLALAEKRVDDAFQLLERLRTAPSSEAVNARELLALTADCLRTKGETDRAIAAYRALTEENAELPDTWMLHAWEQLGAIWLGRGEFDSAHTALTQAALLFSELKRGNAKSSGGYARNRIELDTLPGYPARQLKQTAAAHEAADQPLAAATLYRLLLFRYPAAPGFRAIAVKSGDLFRASGHTAEASVCYLRAVDTGLDRCFSGKALLSTNQPFLNEVAKPPTRELLANAFRGLNECEKAAGTGFALDDTQLQAFVDGWHAALAETFKPYAGVWKSRWDELAAASPALPWGLLCGWAIAQSLLRDACFENAAERFDALSHSAARLPAYRDWMRLGSGLAYLGALDFGRAEDRLQKAAEAADRALAGDALLALSRCAELQGKWRKAAKRYDKVIWEGTVDRHRRLARFALSRVEELKAVGRLKARNALAVLPDDRTTRGDWAIGYGRSHYILCAQNYLTDREGGAGPRLQVRFSTTSPKEPGRLWVSAKRTDDPAALWDPARRTHLSANRDDRGEQFPIGKGPDLILDCKAPAGEHILSLYFVNDHHYYEPSRCYTIDVRDGDSLLALAEVSHFGGGVYKRFRVTGPRDLRMRIRRDLSLNVLLCGVFLDPVPEARALPQAVVRQSWRRQDTLSRIRVAWERSEQLRAKAKFRASEDAFDELIGILASEPESVWRLLNEPTGMQTLNALCQGTARPGLLSDRSDASDSSEKSDASDLSRSQRLWQRVVLALCEPAADPCSLVELADRLLDTEPTVVPGVVRLELLSLLRQQAPDAELPWTALMRTARSLRIDGDKTAALEVLRLVDLDHLSARQRGPVLSELIALAADLQLPDEDLSRWLAALDGCGQPGRAAAARLDLAEQHIQQGAHGTAAALIAEAGGACGRTARLKRLHARCAGTVAGPSARNGAAGANAPR